MTTAIPLLSLADYGQLRLIAWNRREEDAISEDEAFALYEANWRFVDPEACYFGGGTAIVLQLDEYRESLDVDLMCASQDGYRALRDTVNNGSLGGHREDTGDRCRKPGPRRGRPRGGLRELGRQSVCVGRRESGGPDVLASVPREHADGLALGR